MYVNDFHEHLLFCHKIISYHIFGSNLSFLGNDLTEIVSVKVQPLLKRFLRASLGRTDDETSMKLTLVPGSIPSSAIFEFQSVQTILKVRCTLGKNKYSAVDVFHCLELYHATADSLITSLSTLVSIEKSYQS